MQGHMTLPSSLLRPVIRHRRPSAVGLAIAIAFRLAGFAVAENPSARTPNGSAAGDETLAVSTTFNHAPFTYQIRLVQERPEFRVYRLSYPSPVVTPVRQNNTVPAEYYLPKGAGLAGRRYPAVICMHILDGNEALTDLVCTVLASRSIPALSFKLPYYGQRGLPGGPKAIADDPERLAGAVAQAGEDVRRTVDLLASRPEIDPQRIGITGISLGGIIAATAIGGEPRLHRAALLLAGGDLLDIINHARETRPIVEMLARLPPAGRAAIEAKLTQVDPLRFAPAVRDRARAGRVLMINASQDEVVPRRCTEKLAEALGIADRVVWLEGLGHYTALAELPRALRITADFFAQDLPEEERDRPRPRSVEPVTPVRRLVGLLHAAAAMLSVEPAPGRCHYAELEFAAMGPDRRPIEGHLRLVRGAQGRFALACRLPQVGEVAVGQGGFPWMLAGAGNVIVGTRNPAANNPFGDVEPRQWLKLRLLSGLVDSLALAPELLQQWIDVSEQAVAAADRAPGEAAKRLRITARNTRQLPGEIVLSLADDGRTPLSARFALDGLQGTVRFRGWQENTVAADALFEPPAGRTRIEADGADLRRVFAAMLEFALSRLDPPENTVDRSQPGAVSLVARDPAGHGLLCRCQGKRIVIVSGTPAQMGAAQGALLGQQARQTCRRMLYLVGGADTLRSGQWFLDRMSEVDRRTRPHVPARFLAECDALAAAAGVPPRDARLANLVPERFHCSGVALVGRATADGRVLHARVLDYMRDIGLQEAAAAEVFLPQGHYRWMSLGYAGFIGTVTAMNEKGLAIGEMGGRGERDWDGIPMSYLLRDVMERADTAEAALAILRAAPRTCEYYYVLSDRSGSLRAVHGDKNALTVLGPGQQHPLLPYVPGDTVLISGGRRAELLSRRIREHYGRIDVPSLIEIIKRPVAMESNLHDAIFSPQTLEMWFADAGRDTPACDEPYVRVSLRELIDFYERRGEK